MKILRLPTCSYCPDIDDIAHFFCKCDRVNIFWQNFFTWWTSIGEIHTNYPNFPSPHEIIFGMPGSEDPIMVMNFCILHAKHYIYKQRLFHENYLSVQNFLRELRYHLQIEQKICENSNTPEKFAKYAAVCDRLNN